jgi:soluble lytic murein transglycosylase-like protein
MSSPKDFRPEIIAAARSHGLSADLVEAIVTQESSGRADAFRFEPSVWEWFKANPLAAGLNARRAASSYGLMQMLFATATDYGFRAEPEYLFLPKTNLDMGCKHFAVLLKWAKGNVPKALQAYNGGRGGVGRPQTIAYAKSVLRHLDNIIAARVKAEHS